MLVLIKLACKNGIAATVAQAVGWASSPEHNPAQDRRHTLEWLAHLAATATLLFLAHQLDQS